MREDCPRAWNRNWSILRSKLRRMKVFNFCFPEQTFLTDKSWWWRDQTVQEHETKTNSLPIPTKSGQTTKLWFLFSWTDSSRHLTVRSNYSRAWNKNKSTSYADKVSTESKSLQRRKVLITVFLSRLLSPFLSCKRSLLF